MSDSLGPHGLYSPWNSPGQNTGVGSLSLLQGIFPTQGSNPGLPHCRQILYQLSHQGSPRILEWVAYPFSSRSSGPGIEPGSLALQADSLPTELWGKPKWKNLKGFFCAFGGGFSKGLSAACNFSLPHGMTLVMAFSSPCNQWELWAGRTCPLLC